MALQGPWIARSSVIPWHRRRCLDGMWRGEGPLGVSMLAKNNKSKKKPVRNKLASFCHLPVECVRVMRPAFSRRARSLIQSRQGTIAENKQAKFNFQIDEKFECGIALVGTEVKSCRAGKCNIRKFFSAASWPLVLSDLRCQPVSVLLCFYRRCPIYIC